MSRGSKKRESDHQDQQFYQKLQDNKQVHFGEMIDDTKEMKKDVLIIGEQLERDI